MTGPVRLQRFLLSEERIFLALTLIVGVLAGLSAVLFSLAIDEVTRWFFGVSPTTLRLVMIPTVVSLGTGILLAHWFQEARGSGVPQTKAAFYLQQGRIPARVPIGKFLLGVLCIGSGHSMGREGPSVQIGAGIASVLGRWLRLSPRRVRSLVPVGAAGALAAAFNTPVAAVLFVLEELIGDMNAPLLGSTVIASVSAVIVQRSILGSEPLFRVPPYALEHPAELIAYAVLGVVGGVLSLIFCKSLLRLRAAFKKMPARSLAFQPAMGGLALGVILVFVPQVMGVGYEFVDRALNGGLTLQVLVLLLAVKMVATVISYASGNAGGIFAPSLFLGAMAGGAVGIVVGQVAPFETSGPGAYALVGMGALFAGIIRAPMTSVFMIFELTQDYEIFVPLMVANMLSFLISRRFQPVPIYHALTKQDGVLLPEGGQQLGSAWRAGDIMRTDFSFIPPTATIAAASAALRPMPGRTAMVGSPARLVGLVTRDGLDDALRTQRGEDLVTTALARDWASIHVDESLDVALERLRQNPGLLPVVTRTLSPRVEGVITLDALLAFLGDTPGTTPSDIPAPPRSTGTAPPAGPGTSSATGSG